MGLSELSVPRGRGQHLASHAGQRLPPTSGLGDLAGPFLGLSEDRPQRGPQRAPPTAAARPLANAPPYAAKSVSLWPLRSLLGPFHRGDMVAFRRGSHRWNRLFQAVILDHFGARSEHFRHIDMTLL